MGIIHVMTSTEIPQCRSLGFSFLPPSTRVPALTSEWAVLLCYQPTSIFGALSFNECLNEDQAFDQRTSAPGTPSFIEIFENQVFGMFPGRTALKLTEIRPREFSQVFLPASWSASCDERAESTADLLVRIRAHLSLNTSELARALDVERPTIYAWMKNAQIPRPDHRGRLMTLGRLARFWTERCHQPIGKLRYATVEGNLTLVDVLSVPFLDEMSARRVLATLAENARAAKTPLIARSADATHKRARERGWQPVDEETRKQVLRSLSFSQQK
jgi:hypothetical protein